MLATFLQLKERTNGGGGVPSMGSQSDHSMKSMQEVAGRTAQGPPRHDQNEVSCTQLHVVAWVGSGYRETRQILSILSNSQGSSTSRTTTPLDVAFQALAEDSS